MKPAGWVFLFLALLTGVRLALIGAIELSPDEAYYKLWSERLDWAYFSKGPGVAATIKAGTSIFGAGEFGVRFFSPLLSLGTALALYALTRKLYGEAVAVWAVIGAQCIPILQVGGLLMTIDPLSIFFWTAGLLACWNALERAPRFSGWWIVLGACVGLGFLCKYTNLAQYVSLVALLAVSKKYRGEFRRPGFWVATALFAVCTLPPLIWNARHGWITLGHLGARGGLTRDTGFHPLEFLEFLGAHFGAYSPLLFGMMLVALGEGCRQARHHFKARFLMVFALPLIALYSALSFREAGEANWTAPAMVSLGIFAVAHWHALAERARWARALVPAAFAVGLLISAAALNSDGLRRLGVPWPHDYDPSKRLRGWRSAALEVGAFRAKFEEQVGARVFLIGNSYGTASELAYYLPDPRAEGPGHPPVYIPESQGVENQYSFWPRYDELTDLTVLARDYLKAARVESGQRAAAALEDALAHLPGAEASGPQAEEAWRRLIVALKAARPELALDEFFTEQRGISLFAGRSALYVTDREERKPPTSIKEGFERVELVALFKQERLGLPLREIRVFACHNYRGQPL
jgi:hypothetical protein